MQNKIKTLAFYQILTGILGLLFLLLMNLKSSSTIFVIIIGLHSFSIYSGYLLLTKNFEKGLDLSIYNQLIQVVGFGISGFTFEYFSGIFLSLGLNITNDTIINYNAGFNTWILNLGSNSSLFININLVALGLIFFIFKLKNNPKAI
jgi:hypothetical protein